jgi:hypothetical protein
MASFLIRSRLGLVVGTWIFEVWSNGRDDQRAGVIIEALREVRPIENAGGLAWRVEYFPFEDQAAAAGALHGELGAISEHWPEVLETALPGD